MSTDHLIGRFLADRARAAGDAVAVDDRGVTVSYGELDARATALAGRLTDSGYRHGDRIATVSGNSADHVVALFACARAGLVFTPLSWRSTVPELAAQLAHADVALVLTEDEFEARARQAATRLIGDPPVALLGRGGVEAHAPAPGAAAGGADRPIDPAAVPDDDDPLFCLFTSGTSRSPRAALLTHRNCFWTSLAVSRVLPLHREDVVLSVMPQFHVGGWTIQCLLAWWVGATVVLERTFHPGRILGLVAARRVTTMMGVPSHYLFLAQHPDFATTDLSSLRYAVVGGAPMPEALLRTWHARGVDLAQGYGLTEASPNVLCLEPHQARSRAGWAGRPYPHVDVALGDPVTGEHRPDGAASGELLVRGPSVFAGYFRDPAATALAVRDGWLHTGDLAERDDEGCYRVVDRLDDVFVSGGENVSPAEVENVLHAHPAVADAAVIGRPDPQWGETGMAFVVLRAGGFTDAEELLDFCRERLAGYKVPAGVQFVDALPRSVVGKLLRRSLRADPSEPVLSGPAPSVADERMPL